MDYTFLTLPSIIIYSIIMLLTSGSITSTHINVKVQVSFNDILPSHLVLHITYTFHMYILCWHYLMTLLEGTYVIENIKIEGIFLCSLRRLK